MADLKLDADELRASATRADRIAGDMSSAERIASETAGYTGHDGLAGKVHDFADKWDIARGKLEENLTTIADYLRALVDTFDDLDTNLEASLEESAAREAEAKQELDDAIAAAEAPAPTPTPGPAPTPSPGPAPTAPTDDDGGEG